MFERLQKWLSKKYPQNFIIGKPFPGTLIFILFCFAFLLLYRPLKTHESHSFSYVITMAIYQGILLVPIFFGIVKLLKKIRYFSNQDEWTFLKEIRHYALFLSLPEWALQYTSQVF